MLAKSSLLFNSKKKKKNQVTIVIYVTFKSW